MAGLAGPQQQMNGGSVWAIRADDVLEVIGTTIAVADWRRRSTRWEYMHWLQTVSPFVATGINHETTKTDKHLLQK